MIYDIVIRVAEIKGHCSAYKVGDTFHLIDGFKLVAENSLCMQSLFSLMPYYVALSRGISPAVS